jgi:FlaA1/EpsC-like NDP-sugar epimerase
LVKKISKIYQKTKKLKIKKKDINMKKILVTGGAGFIGLNLCKKLLEE